MDSKYCKYLYKNLKKKSVVGIGEIGLYNEIHISIQKETQMKMYGWIGNSKPGLLHHYEGGALYH